VSWILAALGFMVLILLHELGHFAAAKAVGMQATRFSVFFPPFLAKVKRGETEYCLGSIPLGGYVKITGMNPAEEIPAEHAHRAYYRQPVWKRVVVIAAGPLVNIVIFLVVVWALFTFYGVQTPDRPAVGAVETGSPAAAVLRPDDEVIAVDGVRGRSDALAKQIGTHRCAGGRPVDGCMATEPASVTVRRDGVERTFEVLPRYDAGRKRMRLGFSFTYGRETVPPVTAVGDAFKSGWTVTRLTGETLAKIVYDNEARKNVSGVVGSYETSRQAIKFDTARAIEIFALISLSLAIINLLPFLPLDGGHIFWALAERVRGRPIPFSIMERASVVGIFLVVALALVGLSNDISRLSNEGFQVR
jgi:regulator of sigma E protease